MSTFLYRVSKITSLVETNFATATEMFKEVFEKVAKDRQELDEEKEKWEEEKKIMDNKFVFKGPRIVLDVGGMHFSTSRSTLTKYPESMLGIMFSGRHDLETMQCKDGSFFIDRDGTHFRHVLNYLRDGEEVVEYFPKSLDVLSELLREAKFYQLEGLVSLLQLLLRDIDVVNQNKIAPLFFSGSNTYNVDYDEYNYGRGYGGQTFKVNQRSKDKMTFKYKNMRDLLFTDIQFDHAVSFISCDLTNACFQYCCFNSDVIFEDCILDSTTFNCVKGLVTNSCKVSFTGSKTDKAIFDSNLRSSLQSSGKIP